MPHFIEYLQSIPACCPAIEYARQYPTLAAAWDACDNVEWMLWLCDRALTPQQRTLLACDLAETALPYAGDSETLLQCLLTAHICREWAAGREDDETRAAARAAAGDAAGAAWAADAAADAAWDAWDATGAAWATGAARAAARSAAGAARSAGDAAWAARSAATRQHLRITRKRITAAMICAAAGVL